MGAREHGYSGVSDQAAHCIEYKHAAIANHAYPRPAIGPAAPIRRATQTLTFEGEQALIFQPARYRAASKRRRTATPTQKGRCPLGATDFAPEALVRPNASRNTCSKMNLHPTCAATIWLDQIEQASSAAKMAKNHGKSAWRNILFPAAMGSRSRSNYHRNSSYISSVRCNITHDPY